MTKSHSLALAFILLATPVFADSTNIPIPSADAPLAMLTVSSDTKIVYLPEKTVIQTTNLFLNIWSIPNAKTVGEGIKALPEVMKGDVLNFAPARSNSYVFAAGKTMQLEGPSTEADDGDPGYSEVFVFAVGEHVFAACEHGEDEVGRRRNLLPIMAIVATAKAP